MVTRLGNYIHKLQLSPTSVTMYGFLPIMASPLALSENDHNYSTA